MHSGRYTPARLFTGDLAQPTMHHVVTKSREIYLPSSVSFGVLETLVSAGDRDRQAIEMNDPLLKAVQSAVKCGIDFIVRRASGSHAPSEKFRDAHLDR